jgi:hypothetical protein
VAPEIILPSGVRGLDPEPIDASSVGTHVLIDNRTDLPDGMIERGVEDYFVENASLAWGQTSTFQTYSKRGRLAAGAGEVHRAQGRLRGDPLCRDMAEKDDDIRATLRTMVSVAYEGGMQNFHEDERTVALFNEMARAANLDHWFEEIYREYIIAQQVTTITAYLRERVTWTPNGLEEEREERVVVPRPACCPPSASGRSSAPASSARRAWPTSPSATPCASWLEEFFGGSTTAARRAAMAREDPVAATLFIEQVRSED